MRFLIVRTDRLGDVVLTLPMASAIRKAQPDSRISFLVRPYTQPIVERCPDVDEVITTTSLRLRDLVKAMRSAKADVAYFPSLRFTLALAGFLSRIPKRVGTGYRWYSFLFTDKIYEHRRTAEHHEAEYNLGMLGASNIKADETELPRILLRDREIAAVDAWLRENLTDDKFAVLHIPSGGSSKDWPLDRFVELARTLSEQYKIMLTGTEADRETLQNAAEMIGGAHLFIGRPLEELAAVLVKASLVVGNSSGPGHLAAALGTPTIGLFPLPRALSKERWGFRGRRAKNLAPPQKEGCPDCQECTCMERLNVADVVLAIEATTATAA